MNLHKMAAVLDNAALNGLPIEQLSKQKSYNIEEAYAIQNMSMAKRYRRGEKWIGVKLGFTSYAKMEQMGIHEIIWGVLTDEMHYGEDRNLDMKKFIHPRAEPEIAFRLCKNIDRVLDREEVKEYVDAVAIAIEIIDSRYENFSFTLEDVIADNCSSSGFILGEWQDAKMDISNLEIALMMDENEVAFGNTNDILSDPWNAIVEMSKMAEKYCEIIPNGAVILGGAASQAIYINDAKFISATASKLGTCKVKIKKD